MRWKLKSEMFALPQLHSIQYTVVQYTVVIQSSRGEKSHIYLSEWYITGRQLPYSLYKKMRMFGLESGSVSPALTGTC